ncbi:MULTISPECIES: restriction endonuclease subunit S [Limnospira]|uniref:restriction endonuclease subunit S n=1 Tax=Limnospira TaxID=2596745 RepID=UPI0002922FCB|nr:restriction endonuclease subunit S [Limnospira sp. Paracas R14]
MSRQELAGNNNQVPPGYKQTEVGVIPEDWEFCFIRDLIKQEIIEKPLDGNHGNIHPKSNDFVSVGIPFIMANNVFNGVVDTNNCHFIKKEQADNLKKGFSFEGDILLTHKGTVGNVAVVSNILTEYIMLTPQVTYYRVKDFNKLNNIFIKFYFQSSQFQDKIQSLSGGGTRAYIGINNQQSLPFLLPPLPEQKAIASVLSDVDELISSLDKLIAKKRHIKTATMQQLLTGKTRLPGFGGEWETKSLEYLTECLDNLRIPLNEVQRARMKGNYPYCGANGILDYVNEYIIDDDIILLAEDGGYFDEHTTRPIAYRMKGKCWVNNHVHILKAKPGYHQDFLFYCLVHKNVLPFLASGTRAKLNKSEMNKIEINLPKNSEEQKAIASVLSDMDKEIAALEKRRAKTQAIKQGMMQELLTGRTRLIKP